MEILATFALSLVFTLLIETIIALLFGIRMPGMKVVWLVNTLTNPAAVLIFLLLSRVFPAAPALAIQIPIEIIVFVTEALIYGLWFKEGKWGFRHPVLLSLVANLVSWGTGVFVQAL
ncbi:MAG: hypothetical protein IJ773_11055 [Lachnospiraceae bacterium]|nr:hypothetical protein [Lachnospiraceae bacterium]